MTKSKLFKTGGAFVVADKGCVTIDVLALLLNLIVGLLSISTYFSSPDLVPYGGGMCRLAYATFGAMYKPAVISFYGALVAVCDLVYWRIIEGKPKATRVIMGHANHKSEPPISENALTFSCLVVVALVYVCWASVSLAFLPLAVVFFPITLIFGVFLPAILLYGVKAVLEGAERALDVRLKLEDQTVAVNKSVLVKAILA